MEVVFSEAKIPAPPAARSIKPPPEGVTSGDRPKTSEQLAQETKDLYSSMGWGEAPPDPKSPTQPETPGAPAAPTEAPAEPSTPPAEPEPPQPEPEPEQPNVREVIRETAREVGREVTRALVEEPEAPTVPAPDSDLTPEDREDLRVIHYMERSDPKKSGLAQAFINWCKAHYDYQRKWLEANPDKAYDPDAEEHASFYADNQPEIDPKDVEEARIDMRVEQKFQEKMAPREREEKAKEAWQREVPKIAQRLDSKIHSMICQVDGELGKIITKDGQSNISDETIAALEDADPIAKKVSDRIIREEMEPMVLELEKIAIPELNYAFDPSRNGIHARIAQFLKQQEDAMASAPRNVQTRNGAQWISLAEYNTRLKDINSQDAPRDKKQAMINDLNRNYWSLTVDMAQDLIVDYCAKKAKRLIDEEDATAKKKYQKSEKTVTTAPSGQPARQPTTPRSPGARPISPSVGGQPAVATNIPGGPAGGKSFSDAAVDVNFPK